MQGRIDIVTPAGIVEGWCWDESSPNTKVEISVLVDGINSGSAIAGLYREDLRQANIGDGFHHFSLTLPTQMVHKSTHELMLIHHETGRQIGEPFVYQSKAALSFEDRLIEMEAKSRLLETRIEEAKQLYSTTSQAELFSVVGAFFSKLAKDAAHGLQPGFGLQVGDFVKAKVGAHPVLNFARPRSPTFHVVVNADCPLAQLHATLQALHRAGAASTAELTVLDTGRFDDAALISSVVRGVTYIRSIEDFVSEFASIEATTETEFIVNLSGRALVSETFMQELQECASLHTKAGAIGACITDDEGRVLCAGLKLTDGELIADRGEGTAAVHPAHAITHHAAAIRRAAFQRVGGLDLLFGNDVASAFIDLCFRLRRDGYPVLIDPYATIALQGNNTSDTLTSGIAHESSQGRQLLRASWLDQKVDLHVGRALVLGTSSANFDDLHVVRYLNEACYLVTYLAQDDRASDTYRRIRRAGATVVPAISAQDIELVHSTDIIYAPDGLLPPWMQQSSARVIVSFSQLDGFLTAQRLVVPTV